MIAYADGRVITVDLYLLTASSERALTQFETLLTANASRREICFSTRMHLRISLRGIGLRVSLAGRT